ncbi:hypothetical protein D3C86_1338130 [compost metagenome]
MHLVAQVLEADLAKLSAAGMVVIATGLKARDVVHRDVGPEQGGVEVARVGVDARIVRAIGPVGEIEQGG